MMLAALIVLDNSGRNLRCQARNRSYVISKEEKFFFQLELMEPFLHGL